MMFAVGAIAVGQLYWHDKYKQRTWLRLDHAVSREMEDGTPFPSTAKLASRWLRGRVPLRPKAGASLESAFCAEIVAVTYENMRLLPKSGPTGTTPGPVLER